MHDPAQPRSITICRGGWRSNAPIQARVVFDSLADDVVVDLAEEDFVAVLSVVGAAAFADATQRAEDVRTAFAAAAQAPAGEVAP